VAATNKVVCAIGQPHSVVDITGTPEASAIEAEWAENEPGTGAKWLADQAAQLANVKTQAKATVADVEPDEQSLARATRALALVTLSEVNNLRQWDAALKSAAAGAGTFAQFKTVIAALPNTSDRTAAQLRQAIRDQIDAE